MRIWCYEFGGLNQTLKGDLTWSCTCQHGSLGRFKRGNNFPCVHIICALKQWSTELLRERGLK
jgi:hypothetical protein